MAKEMPKLVLATPPTHKPVRLCDILISKGRILIPEVLTQHELNITEIARRVGLNHASVTYHLKALTTADVVEEKVFGRRVKIYRLRAFFDSDNPENSFLGLADDNNLPVNELWNALSKEKKNKRLPFLVVLSISFCARP